MYTSRVAKHKNAANLRGDLLVFPILEKKRAKGSLPLGQKSGCVSFHLTLWPHEGMAAAVANHETQVWLTTTNNNNNNKTLWGSPPASW